MSSEYEIEYIRGAREEAARWQAGTGSGSRATAWYIFLSQSYWARWLNSLHLPYTLWHLSYVALGVGLGPAVRWDVLGWAILAFFLGLGVAGHVFDLLKGDPLALRLPRRHLQVAGGISLALAALIGAGNLYWGNVPWGISILVLAGVVIALGYNLEWPGMHGDPQFALFWGTFPFTVGYLAMGGADLGPLVFGGLFSFLTSWAQRVLSTRARFIRRRVTQLTGVYSTEVIRVWCPGGRPPDPQDFDRAWVLAPIDQALMVLSFAMPVLAAGVLLGRL